MEIPPSQLMRIDFDHMRCPGCRPFRTREAATLEAKTL